jgi:AcrR family transcriptional regulator
MAKTAAKESDITTSQRAPIRREDILDEASKLFAARGFSGTNLKDVASRLGCTRQALYYHFVSKDELVREVVQTAYDEVRGMLELFLDADLPPLEKLALILGAYARICLRRQPVIAVYNNRRHVVPPAYYEVTNRRERYHLDEVTKIVAQWQQESGKADHASARTQALFLFGACNSTLTWFRPDGPDDIDTVADAIVRFVLQGMTGHPYGTAAEPAVSRDTTASHASAKDGPGVG